MHKLAPVVLFFFLTACGGGGSSSNTAENETPDTTPPVITVNGGDTTITVGTAYNDLGATAIDNKDGIINVTTTGTVDSSTLGNYTINYSAIDAAGNAATATRIIRVIPVPDTTPPVITIIGGNETIEKGDSYTDKGATANDNIDGVVNVSINNLVDINNPGTYTITYTATDASGNSSSATRVINVIDSALEAITKIKGFADNPTENQTPTESDYIKAGVNEVTPDNISEVNRYIGTLSSSDVDSSNKIQKAINLVNESINLLTVEPDRTLTNWMFSTYTDPLTDVVTTFARLPSPDMTISILCSSTLKTLMVSTDFITGDGEVKYRFGDSPSISETWSESSSFKSLFPPASGMHISRGLLKHNKFILQANKFPSGVSISTFDNLGFPVAIDQTRGVCSWPSDDFPEKNGWGSNDYPVKPPVYAKESTYNESAPNQFRLVAWFEQNTSGTNQLLVRIGDQTKYCKSQYSSSNDFRITDKRLFVIQNEEKIPVFAASKIIQNCNEPGIYALNGNFDVNQPFKLQEFGLSFLSNDKDTLVTSIDFP